MFVKRSKILLLWGIIAGLMVVIFAQAFGSHGFVMVKGSSSVKSTAVKSSGATTGIMDKGKLVNKTGSATEIAFEGKTIKVCINGAVKKPGTVILPENSRLEDGIKGVGGFLPNAARNYLNLADFLVDGAFVYIQTKEEEKRNGDNAAEKDGISNQKSGGKININSASAKELDSLPGVGEATADKIIEFRKSKGQFKKVEDLKNVSGIGDAKFLKLKGLIKIR